MTRKMLNGYYLIHVIFVSCVNCNECWGSISATQPEFCDYDIPTALTQSSPLPPSPHHLHYSAR